jgi:predicted RNA-binding Zn ribbon-like protein
MAQTWKSAPGDLDLVRQFVETLEIDGESRTEELRTPELLGSWLKKRGLLSPTVRLTNDDLARALELREALRGILLAHNGVSVGREPFEAFDRLAADARLSVRVVGDGGTRLEPTGSGLEGAIGRIAAIVYEAGVEGTWPRLKACAADDCQMAFYDASRNRSGTWCDMSSCGNRAKVRAYRQRSRASGGAGDAQG